MYYIVKHYSFRSKTKVERKRCLLLKAGCKTLLKPNWGFILYAANLITSYLPLLSC